MKLHSNHTVEGLTSQTEDVGSIKGNNNTIDELLSSSSVATNKGKSGS